MNRRNFVSKASMVAIGLSTSTALLAGTSSSLSMSSQENTMLLEFRKTLASYEFGSDGANPLLEPQTIHSRREGFLEYTSRCNSRITLSTVKGRVVARLK